MKVHLEHNVWIAPWDGDPGRTVVFESAQEFKTIDEASKALEKARKYRPFPNAEIVDDFI